VYALLHAAVFVAAGLAVNAHQKSWSRGRLGPPLGSAGAVDVQRDAASAMSTVHASLSLHLARVRPHIPSPGPTADKGDIHKNALKESSSSSFPHDSIMVRHGGKTSSRNLLSRSVRADRVKDYNHPRIPPLGGTIIFGRFCVSFMWLFIHRSHFS